MMAAQRATPEIEPRLRIVRDEEGAPVAWEQLGMPWLVVVVGAQPGPPIGLPLVEELAGRPVEEWRARVPPVRAKCRAPRRLWPRWPAAATPEAAEAARELAGCALRDWRARLAPVLPSTAEAPSQSPAPLLEWRRPASTTLAVSPPTPLTPDRVTSPRRRGYSLGTNTGAHAMALDRAESKRLKLHLLPDLPANYGECYEMPRPCLFFRCRHNLWLDVKPESGSIRMNFPGQEPEDLEYTCSIDAALGGGPPAKWGVPLSLARMGEIMNVTEVWAGQLVTEAIGEVKAKVPTGEEFADRGTDEVDEFEDDPPTKQETDDDGE